MNENEQVTEREKESIDNSINPEEVYYNTLMNYQITYPLLKTALSCCRREKGFHYKADLYPIYLIVLNYISVLELHFLEIEFVK